MPKKRLQVFATTDSENYINDLILKRKEEGHYNDSVSGIASEILELGCRVHKLQQEKEGNEPKEAEFDLKGFCKEMVGIVVKANAFSQASLNGVIAISENTEIPFNIEDTKEIADKKIESIHRDYFS